MLLVLTEVGYPRVLLLHLIGHTKNRNNRCEGRRDPVARVVEYGIHHRGSPAYPPGGGPGSRRAGPGGRGHLLRIQGRRVEPKVVCL